MSQKGINRRDFMAGAAGVGTLSLLAPLTVLANGSEPSLSDFLDQPELPLEVERQQLIKEVRDKALGFDLRELAYRIAGNFDFVSDIKERIDEALEGSDTSQGLRSYRTIDPMKVNNAFSPCRNRYCIPKHVITDKIKSLLNMGSNLISPQEKKDPRVVEFYKERIAFLTRALMNSLLEIDNGKLERHVKRYPEKDMAIYYGPGTKSVELFGGLFHETFAHYLQMVHGRQATELWPVDPPGTTPQPTDKRRLYRSTRDNPQMHNLAQALFNPEFQHVAMISHGSWDSYSLSGLCVEPAEVLAKLLVHYNQNPAEAVDIVSRGSTYELVKKLDLPKSSLSVTNELLDRWIEQFCAIAGISRDEFNSRFQKSGNFVRYTCGYGKYDLVDAKLYHISGFIPKRIQEMIGTTWGTSGFSAKDPSFVGEYEADVKKALDRYNRKRKKKARIKENDGFGLPIVKDPSQLFGYEGGAWMDNYIEDPIPLQGKI